MNTKQKLTLGIAAIFMVTLTIVGVTYAYFVTQVVGEGNETDISVGTAKFGAVEYVPSQDGKDIVLADVLPGTPEATKTYTFGVKNNGAEGEGTLTYSLDLKNTMTSKSTEGDRAFLSTVTTSDVATAPVTTGACYFGPVGTTPENIAVGNVPSTCTGGDWYDNVYVTIERTDAFAITAEEKTPLSRQRLSTDGTVPVLSNVSIDANTTHEYKITVEYVDANGNQNYETEAELVIMPDIR